MDYLKPLPWDSEHFGIKVAQIVSPDLGDATARTALGIARRDGIGLVYWATRPDRELPAALLREYAGKLVDRKATFQRVLPAQTPGKGGTGPWTVFPHPKGPPPPALLALAVSAGQYSRFKIDTRIPVEKFLSLYEAWITGSTFGRLADVVLVASSSRDRSAPAGMVTIARHRNVGTIGLIAVRDTARGQGVGSLLMHEAHGWMESQGLTTASVVTQLDNPAACALYRRSGYHLHDLTHVYHFFPLHGDRPVS